MQQQSIKDAHGFLLAAKGSEEEKERLLVSPEVTQTLPQNTDAYTQSTATINQNAHLFLQTKMECLHLVSSKAQEDAAVNKSYSCLQKNPHYFHFFYQLWHLRAMDYFMKFKAFPNQFVLFPHRKNKWKQQ